MEAGCCWQLIQLSAALLPVDSSAVSLLFPLSRSEAAAAGAAAETEAVFVAAAVAMIGSHQRKHQRLN